MRFPRAPSSEHLSYQVGLDKIQEAVISSHFMHELAANSELQLYDEGQFVAKALDIDAEAVHNRLIPAMREACDTFSKDRATAARSRARENYRKYGLADPRKVGTAQFITEVMFDRQYRREPLESCSRELLCSTVAERIESGSPIEMVIPALPFKFSSPLKTRGRLPDLAELNFILGLYEIVSTIEQIYRAARPDLRGRLAGFTVVSDGSRYNRLVNEPDSVIERYRNRLGLWIERLRLEQHINILDYRSLLRDSMPASAWQRKAEIADRARTEYGQALWPIFDPNEMASAMTMAARVEPDPEYSNPAGRFVSLLKSLVYTIKYDSLKMFERMPVDAYHALYRDLTAHIFKPYTAISPSELARIRAEADVGAGLAPTERVKEYLRQTMLRESWGCAIDYMAEIKSDRELAEDPILTCLPGHLRWTIHAKAGQLAVSTPIAAGIRVQAWAGAAVFRLTRKNDIKLCTLPVLALEGAGAIPVRVSGMDDALALADQPLFYIYPDVTFADMDDFLAVVRRSLVRRRTN
ncbi:L-tyrosine/L-tryptophan isonitrile synthase family protein [Streptosporangium sp. CA-115845]|uniref:L-tyrosine/L-tryptophan isonitrile synthase family protein n=1 Tax=Streptosporangium sp. CA-115845 TaxID=3240071 RepID=UPI003D8F93D9